MQSSYAGRVVIRAGEDIQCVYDGDQQAQAYEWVLPNIFAPFRAEYWNGWEFGSLWEQWVRELAASVHQLQASTNTSQAEVSLAAATVKVSSGSQVAISASSCDDHIEHLDPSGDVEPE